MNQEEIERVIELFDYLLSQREIKESLRELEKTIIRGTLKNQTYTQIAQGDDSPFFSQGFIENVGAKLWQKLDSAVRVRFPELERLRMRNLIEVSQLLLNSDLANEIIFVNNHYQVISTWQENQEYVNTYKAKKYQSLDEESQYIVKKASSQEGKKALRIESGILQLLDHPQIPELQGCFQAQQYSYLVREYINGHSLEKELNPQQPWSENQVKDFLKEALEILSFVHEHDIIIRHIKPTTIIRRDEDKKLCFTNFIYAKTQSSREVFDSLSTIQSTIIRDYFTAPEVRQGTSVLASDIYSLGLIAIQVITNLPIKKIIKRDYQTGANTWPKETDISSDLAKILERMIHIDYQQRYSYVGEVLKVL